MDEKLANVEGEPELPELNPRQRAFVAEYLRDLNGTQAAIRAGYSAATAGEISSRLLTDARIANAVARGKEHRLAAVNVSAETILAEMNALASSDVDHYVITDDGRVALAPGAPPNAMKAIQSIKRKTRIETRGKGEDAVEVRHYDVELRLWDKPGSLKLMGKHAGVKACYDRLEVSGPDGGPIPITEVRSVVVDPQKEGDGNG